MSRVAPDLTAAASAVAASSGVWKACCALAGDIASSSADNCEADAVAC